VTRPIIDPYCKKKVGQKILKSSLQVSYRPGALTMSIPESFNHPDAGCFIIDDAVYFKSVRALLKLFASLSVDVNQKPKNNIVL
jgi:hypothetical protein